ncbi:metalloreductase STEAP4-like isoform X3 [Dendronephthya gigantea]|nr:metalloreductase STEAP4-like isoform X3 [Dendronephthya gigantea]XP_028404858.1 metalloreductase STEAP4-like isoform X3 [Dendronephthya gigantea]
MDKNREISIIGTGDFGCALAKRLIQNGYQVTIGSRSPLNRNLGKRNETLKTARVVSVRDSIMASNMVIVAIPYEHVGSLKSHEDILEGKILVDVSNPSTISKERSNAEKLADLLPKSVVVKCFNTMSAYSIDDDTSNEHRQVYVASDDAHASEVVIQLAKDIGFAAHNVGRLQKARDLESNTLYLFRGWGWPTLFTIGLFLAELLYLFIVMYMVVDRYEKSQIPTYVLYKAAGAVSLNLLAFCYLPGVFAAFAQIYYGSKHTRFQPWLNSWLQGRKQLGIYSLLFGFVHMITVMSCMNGAYFDYLFKRQYVTVKGNGTDDTIIPVDTKMNLHGEGCIATGLIALCSMAIVGLASVPAIGSLLNWREWRFIQSRFGLVCFLLTVGHCMVHGVPRWMIQRDLVLRNSFMSLIFPWFTLLLKIIYFVPCVHLHVWKIRSGYERGVRCDFEKSSTESYANEAFANGKKCSAGGDQGVQSGSDDAENGDGDSSLPNSVP